MFGNMIESASDLKDNVSDKLADRRTEKQLRELQQGVTLLTARVAKLDRRFAASQRGFPWGLLLAAGVGYLAVNRPARDRVMGWLGQVSPSAQDAVQQVAGRVTTAVSDVKDGKDVREAATAAAKGIGEDLKQAAPDIQRDVQQKASDVKDKAQQVAGQAQQAASDAKDKAQQVAGEAKDKAQQAAGDAKDKAQASGGSAPSGQTSGMTGGPQGQSGKDLSKEQVSTPAQNQKPSGR